MRFVRISWQASSPAHLLLFGLPPFLLPIFGFHPFAFLHVSLRDSRVPDVDTFCGCPTVREAGKESEGKWGGVSKRLFVGERTICMQSVT